MTVVHYYYRKPDGTLGKLLDDSPEAIKNIDENLKQVSWDYQAKNVLAVVEGSVE
jgi:hypothetical protein